MLECDSRAERLRVPPIPLALRQNSGTNTVGSGPGAAGPSHCTQEQRGVEPKTVMNLTLSPAGGTSSLTSEVTIPKKSKQNDPVAPVMVPQWPETSIHSPGKQRSPVSGGTLWPFSLSGAPFSGGFLEAGVTGAFFSWLCETSG